MVITSTQLKRCILVRMSGRFDSFDAPDVRNAFKNLMDGDNYKIVVNMKEVVYLSSESLKEILSAWKNCRRWSRGDVRFCEISRSTQRVLDLTGLNPKVRLFQTEVDAVGSF